ncbi:aldo/keto reductase [Pseudonocardia sp.]|jgi:2,5-diketo-D-gluconate reductase A|uniref:aldo/keto reductase n=1 Tax=Pseudonocardia sp. TaxID=60912 RepID=UPI002DA60A3E|nr:aldo/keto reductase [Pseudonocardia sp.]
MSRVPKIRLNNGVGIPQLGFGVFQIEPDRTAEAVLTAFEAGYRHIDTAQGYNNEEGVGEAIRASGLRRGEIFVTTKLANDRHGYDEAISALDESLQRLGLDHVDLYLIHWPRPAQNRYVETWKAFEKIASDGKARAIGVSNFHIPHLERLAQETATVPAVNQIELHPWLPQTELRAYHQRHGIATEAWSPLAKGGELLADELIVGLAQKYGKTPAQIVLRWHLQLGNIAIPKSVTPSRVRENADVFDFELSDDDVASISELGNGRRLGPDPDNFG